MTNYKNIFLVLLGIMMFINIYAQETNANPNSRTACFEYNVESKEFFHSISVGWIGLTNVYSDMEDNFQFVIDEDTGEAWFIYSRFGKKHVFLQADYTNIAIKGNRLQMPTLLAGVRTSPSEYIELSLAGGGGVARSNSLGISPLAKLHLQASINIDAFSIFSAFSSNIEFGGKYFPQELPGRGLETENNSKVNFLNNLRLGIVYRFSGIPNFLRVLRKN